MGRAMIVWCVAAAAVLGAGQRGAAETARSPCERGTRYKGPTIDLDVKDADLHNVFRFLADAGNVNIVVPDEVKGSVTLRLRRVLWEQALCTVARVKKLEIVKEDSVYTVQVPGKGGGG